MDQSLVHTFSWGNLHGPMVLKVLLKFPPKPVLVHGWLFPVLLGVSSGASGGSLHRGARFKEEQDHFSTCKKGPENQTN